MSQVPVEMDVENESNNPSLVEIHGIGILPSVLLYLVTH